MKNVLTSLLICTCPFLVSSQAVLTAVFDADLPGGLPKGSEVYVLEDIADLSLLGIGSANNGQGTGGVEFAFPSIAVDSGTYLYVASDSASFADFFGFNADFISVAMAINGDDAIELFWDSVVIDVFGEINVDGTGQPWEYTDGWAARKALTGPDGATFVLPNWYFSGVAGLDGETTNGTAQNPVPLQSYTDTTMTGPDVTIILQNLAFIPANVTIEVGQTVRWTNVEMFEAHNVNGQVALFPCNPTGFYSGDPALGPWDYDVTFNVAGVYEYQCDPHAQYGMVGTLTVVDPNAPDYPQYDISVLHSEDASGIADSVGVHAEVQGVVHGPNFRPGGLQFTIIDVNTGVGINVFKNDGDCYEVTEGDLVSIRGEITQFNGLTEIIPGEQITVLSSGNSLMEPVVVTGALLESMESTMATIEDLVVDSIVSTGSSGWNLYGGGYVVRLDADAFTDVSSYEGQVLNVTGIVGQFDDEEPYTEGYQLQPRSPQDIAIANRVVNLPASAMQIRPNPVVDQVSIQTDLQIVGITIYSATGTVMIQKRTAANTLDVSSLPSGTYLLIAETPDGMWSARLIKT